MERANIMDRVTIHPDVMVGKPTIRGLRITNMANMGTPYWFLKKLICCPHISRCTAIMHDIA